MTIQPEELSTLIADIESRLRILEGTSPLTKASIQDGALRVLDADLEARVVLGKQADGSYGIWIYDATGTYVIVKLNQVGLTVFDDDGEDRVSAGSLGSGKFGLIARDADGATERFRADERGLIFPYLQASFLPIVNDTLDTRTIRVTSATFASYYRAQFGQITHQGVGIRAVCTTDVGTTAEFRVISGAGGATDAVAVGSGGSVSQGFDWLHDYALNVGPAYFEVQCRRTSGAGNAYIWLPHDAAMRSPDGCVSDGVP